MSSSASPEICFSLHIMWSLFCAGHFSFSSMSSLPPSMFIIWKDAFVASVLKSVQ